MLGYILLAAGIWLIFSAWFVSTQNTRSFVFFKLVPLILGVVLLFQAAMYYGYVVNLNDEQHRIERND